jgi:hypothetical protein
LCCHCFHAASRVKASTLLIVMLSKESRQVLLLLLCYSLSQTRCCNCCQADLVNKASSETALGGTPRVNLLVMLPKESRQVLVLLLSCCTRSQGKGCFCCCAAQGIKASANIVVILLLESTKCCHCCYSILSVKPSAAIVVMLPKESRHVLPLLLC